MTRKIFPIILSAAVIVTFLAVHSSVNAKDKNMPAMTEAEMMQKMSAAMTPGDMQKKLNAFNGNWNVTSKMMMPGKDPVVSTGAMESKWTMDGRFLTMDWTSPDRMGMPYHGMGIFGYDNTAKRYQASWIETSGTQIFQMQGSWKDDKNLVWTGKSSDPMTGKTDQPVKGVFTVKDNNHVHVEHWGTDANGKEMLFMEADFSRK